MVLPEGTTILEPILHPADGQPGTAVRLASGAEVFYDGCAIRSLPRDWRRHQRPDVLGMAVARCLTWTFQGNA